MELQALAGQILAQPKLCGKATQWKPTGIKSWLQFTSWQAEDPITPDEACNGLKWQEKGQNIQGAK